MVKTYHLNQADAEKSHAKCFHKQINIKDLFFSAGI